MWRASRTACSWTSSLAQLRPGGARAVEVRLDPFARLRDPGVLGAEALSGPLDPAPERDPAERGVDEAPEDAHQEHGE